MVPSRPRDLTGLGNNDQPIHLFTSSPMAGQGHDIPMIISPIENSLQVFDN